MHLKNSHRAMPEIINPCRNTCYGWHAEQTLFDPMGIARALKAGGGTGNMPKILLRYN